MVNDPEAGLHRFIQVPTSRFAYARMAMQIDVARNHTPSQSVHGVGTPLENTLTPIVSQHYDGFSVSCRAHES